MKILLADDDQAVRRVFQFKLSKQGHDVTTAADGEEALAHLREGSWDVLVSDIRMPRIDGLELLERAHELHPNLKIILITAHATVAQAVQAVKLGAFDYITKPFEDEELYTTIDKAAAFTNLEEENRLLRSRLQNTERAPRLIGVSPAFKEMMRVVERVASSDATVLLTGASGTGKEVVAKTIHARSHRAGGDFVAVNCGAIPRELVESELFGHVKGAFTGATRDKRGKFELASGGTILLDEVGDLPLEMQVKLLRVLQERVIERVGSEKSIEIDVRVVAATHVDLKERVRDGAFREDLFYRLNVIPVRVPSLSERRDDIPLLVRAFAERSAAGASITVDDELMRRFVDYDWPGNIRELENLLERMVVLRRGDVLTVRDLPVEFGNEPKLGGRDAEQVTFREAEESLIRNALDKTGWNKAQAARLLKIPRHVLLYRMKKYDIESPN